MVFPQEYPSSPLATLAFQGMVIKVKIEVVLFICTKRTFWQQFAPKENCSVQKLWKPTFKRKSSTVESFRVITWGRVKKKTKHPVRILEREINQHIFPCRAGTEEWVSRGSSALTHVSKWVVFGFWPYPVCFSPGSLAFDPHKINNWTSRKTGMFYSLLINKFDLTKVVISNMTYTGSRGDVFVVRT